MTGYIAQTRLSLRASTMVRVEGVLREFAGWLALHAPDVGCVADLRRRHIEAYKLHLAARPSARGGKLTKTSLAEHLGALRTCFERLTEWNGDDVPSTVLIRECGIARPHHQGQRINTRAPLNWIVRPSAQEITYRPTHLGEGQRPHQRQRAAATVISVGCSAPGPGIPRTPWVQRN